MKPVRNQARLGFYSAVGSDRSNNPFDTQAGCVCVGGLGPLTTHFSFFFSSPSLKRQRRLPAHPPLRISQSFTTLKADTPFTSPHWLGSGSGQLQPKFSRNALVWGQRSACGQKIYRFLNKNNTRRSCVQDTVLTRELICLIPITKITRQQLPQEPRPDPLNINWL